MTQKPQRYELRTNYRCGQAIEEMEPDDDGEWVRWEAIEKQLADVESLRAQNQEQDNHHNALTCPHCNPKGLVLVEASLTEQLASAHHEQEKGALKAAFLEGYDAADKSPGSPDEMGGLQAWALSETWRHILEYRREVRLAKTESALERSQRTGESVPICELRIEVAALTSRLSEAQRDRDDLRARCVQWETNSKENKLIAEENNRRAEADEQQLTEAQRTLDRYVTGYVVTYRMLETLSASMSQIDNGGCAICRIGHRLWTWPGGGKKGVPGPCSNSECMSHGVMNVLIAEKLPFTIDLSEAQQARERRKA